VFENLQHVVPVESACLWLKKYVQSIQKKLPQKLYEVFTLLKLGKISKTGYYFWIILLFLLDSYTFFSIRKILTYKKGKII
jgi:hypothetical protein